jgi:hypothetical protein
VIPEAPNGETSIGHPRGLEENWISIAIVESLGPMFSTEMFDGVPKLEFELGRVVGEKFALLSA